MFQHLLHEERITVSLSGDKKEEIFKQLIDLLPSWQFTAKTKKKLLEMLLLRESYGTTAIGDNIALPHVSLEEIDVPVAVMGLSKQGVPFSALDGEPVHVIYLALFPKTEVIKQTRKEVLTGAHKFLADSFVRQQLCHCHDSSMALQILNADQQHSSKLYEVGAI